MALNLTTGQYFAIGVGILSATAGATAQLTPVFGDTAAHAIVSIANLIMTVGVAPVMFVLTGQRSMVQSVAAMPGIQTVAVNAKANPTLAALAVSEDDVNKKIEATPAAQAAIEATAKGA